MSRGGYGLCRTCEHYGCCDDLPHCGGKYWVSAWDDDEEPEESEEEGENGGGEDRDDGEDGDDV